MSLGWPPLPSPTGCARIRLNNINCLHFDHVPPNRHIAILLTASHIKAKRLSDFPCLFKFPVRARLFKMADTIIFKYTTNFDRTLW